MLGRFSRKASSNQQMVFILRFLAEGSTAWSTSKSPSSARPRTVKDRIFVVFRMNRGVVSARKSIRVILLLAVIRQGLAGNLPSGDAAAVGEGSKK